MGSDTVPAGSSASPPPPHGTRGRSDFLKDSSHIFTSPDLPYRLHLSRVSQMLGGDAHIMPI